MDKRYLVFKFEQYYPAGGMNDLIESFDLLEEAVESITGSEDNCQIYDRVEGIMIKDD